MTFRSTIITALALLATAPSAWAAAGDLDPTFDGDGRRILGYGGADYAYELFVQGDGKILVAGFGGPNRDFTLSRLNPNGSLDLGFDGDGTAVADFGGADQALAAAVQPGGEIVLAGSSDGKMAVARFKPDGSLDASFDPGGTDGPGKKVFGAEEPAMAVAVLVQGDGRIVLARDQYNKTDSDFGLVRLYPDGSPDGTTFDPADFLGGGDTTAAAALQPDGRILVSGTARTPAGAPRIAVARYTAAGKLDTTFGGTGKRTFGVGERLEAPAVLVQPDGRIVVAGTGAEEYDAVVARLKPDGSFDPGFGTMGTSAISFFGVEVGTAAVLQPDGKIVVAGATLAPGLDADFAVARLLPGGALDPAFSSDGKTTISFGAGESAGTIARQPDGRIVVAGSTDANDNIALARLQADARPVPGGQPRPGPCARAALRGPPGDDRRHRPARRPPRHAPGRRDRRARRQRRHPGRAGQRPRLRRSWPRPAPRWPGP